MMCTTLLTAALGLQAHGTSLRAGRHCHCRAGSSVCLDKQEVMGRLSAVPVFGVANGAGQLMSTVDAETGDSVVVFYLDVAEAQASLAAEAAADPTADLRLKVAPLATAFAAQSAGGSVRLQPSQAEYNSIRQNLGFGAARPEEGEMQLVPLFYSDALNFESASGGEMRPLFFSAGDFREAWAASGQAADQLPALQLIDLRSLAYKMEHGEDEGWRSAVLIPPEASVEYASGQR